MNVLFLEKYFSQEYIEEVLLKKKEIENIYIKKNINFLKNDIQIIFTRLQFSLNKKMLSKYKNLKFIVTPTTGLTHIDQLYCNYKNIRIISLKNKTNQLTKFSGTAELALGLIINLNLYFKSILNSTLNKEWDRNKFMSYQLLDKTLGIVGYGRLGKMLSQYGLSLGMKIISYDPKKIINEKHIKQVELNYLLKNSDFISIHANYLENENYHLIGKKEIDLLKKEVILINTARGELVDLNYLIQKLKDGKIRGLGIDTIEDEYKFDRDILELQKNFNIIFTPHIGGCKYESTMEAEKIVLKLLLDNI